MSKIRIAKAIKENHPHLSLNFIKSILKDGHVLLNQRKAKLHDWVTREDEIIIDESFLQKEIQANSNLNCKILFEDDHFLFFSKPSGMHSICHNATQNNTAANWLLSISKDFKNVSSPLESGLLNRLDSETSGVLVAAKTKESFLELKNLFREKKVLKEYFLSLIHI